MAVALKAFLILFQRPESRGSKIGFNLSTPSSADSLERGHVIQTVLQEGDVYGTGVTNLDL